MKRFCKNILPISLALILGLTSCADKDIDPVDPLDSSEIQFGKVTTRIPLEDYGDEALPFGLWASASNAYTNGYQSLLPEEEKVYYVEDEDKWTYDNKMYWANNTHFYFLATYPYDCASRFTQHVIEDGGQSYILYLMPVDTGSQADADILTAYNHTYTGDNGFAPANPVVLEFTHLLTKVNFKIAQDTDKDKDGDYYITKVTLAGIKGNGNYFFFPINDEFYDGWNMETSTTVAYVKDYSSDPVWMRESDALDDDDFLSVWGGNDGTDGLFLIPSQDLSGGVVQIYVDYLYVMQGKDWNERTEGHASGVVPASYPWVAGQSFTYTMSIAEMHDITFSTPVIEPWGSPQTGGTIIIK